MAFPALPFALPSLPWKWIGVALAALAVVAVVFFSIRAYGDARYDAGTSDERAVWEKMVADDRLKAEELQRAADAALAAAKDDDEAALERSRKELADAVADIPDQPTSDRQRTRACFELLRAGTPSPACQSDAAR